MENSFVGCPLKMPSNLIQHPSPRLRRLDLHPTDPTPAALPGYCSSKQRILIEAWCVSRPCQNGENVLLVTIIHVSHLNYIIIISIHSYIFVTFLIPVIILFHIIRLQDTLLYKGFCTFLYISTLKFCQKSIVQTKLILFGGN